MNDRGCLGNDSGVWRPNGDRECLGDDSGVWRPNGDRGCLGDDDDGRTRINDGGDRRSTNTMAMLTGPAFTGIGRGGSDNDRHRRNHCDGNDGVRS